MLKRLLARAKAARRRWVDRREELSKQRKAAVSERNHKRADRRRKTEQRKEVRARIERHQRQVPDETAPESERRDWETRMYELRGQFRDVQKDINRLHAEIDDAAAKIARLTPKIAYAEKRVRFYVKVRIPHIRRRIRRAQASSQFSPTGSRIVTIEGRQCAEHLAYRIQVTRAAGWSAPINSAWRDPAYSEQLCYNMCGAPVCPGRCAGRGSAHSGSNYPTGAIDVSDPYTFGALQRSLDSRVEGYVAWNALGSADPWHFSYNGR